MTAENRMTPERLLDRVEGRLAAAWAARAAGGIGDLSGLDADIQRLRDGAAALPAAEAKRLRPRLLSALEEIDRLGAAFRGDLDGLGKEIGATARRRQAVSAYHQGQQNKPGGGR